MLETVRAFVSERLAARPDATDIHRRHAGYTGRWPPGLLLRAGQREWAGRLQAEAGNLAAAVRWYLAHDRAPLPHLLRVLWLFWELQDHLGEVHAWAGQLLPTASTLDPQARAELLWTAVVTAVEVGDDPAALAARQRLRPLLDGIGDPFLRALCQLAMAWTSAILGDDLDGALREASVSLGELRGQDAPFWTASAAALGAVETAVGRYDDAHSHLTEARDLAERIDNPWLAAVSRVYLGTLALVRGQPEEARAPLDEALGLSLAAHSTRSVTSCLAAFAQLGARGGRPRAGGAAGRGGRGPAPAGRAAGVADPAAGRDRAGGPGPPGARRRPLRPGVRRGLPAHPAGGGGGC